MVAAVAALSTVLPAVVAVQPGDSSEQVREELGEFQGTITIGSDLTILHRLGYVRLVDDRVVEVALQTEEELRRAKEKRAGELRMARLREEREQIELEQAAQDANRRRIAEGRAQQAESQQIVSQVSGNP